MGEMLANRYLLNGKAAQALELYRQALARRPGKPETECRSILAQLEIEEVDQVAEFIGNLLKTHGMGTLGKLESGCHGFVPTDVPRDHGSIKGLRALLAGDLPRAKLHLGKLDPDRFPAIAALVHQLEAQGA